VDVFHNGNFIQGQQAAYSIAVSNAVAAAPTGGIVTVTENLPAALSLVSMAGNGWTCVNNTCNSSTVLSPGSLSAPITVTVNVASGFSGQVVNEVTVSGGGSATNTTSNPTTITQSSVCDVGGNGIADVTDVQLTINAALGKTTAVGDLNQDGMVNVVDVQIDIQAVLYGNCLAAVAAPSSKTAGVPSSLRSVQAVPVTSPSVAGIAQSYQIMDLGTLGGSTATARGINNLSQVVGESDTGRSGTRPLKHAFLWEAGQMTDLGPPAATGSIDSVAYAINDSGQATGAYSYPDKHTEGFRYSAGTTSTSESVCSTGVISSKAVSPL
jgi:probable HAF family extracellular repeat protein